MTILVTINERQQVLSLQKHCSVDLYFFSPTLKKVVYLSKTGAENILNCQTGPLQLSL